ncbi:putative flavin-containing monooxygenase [Myxococcus hansupus]|uniref:Putative flavin-containing monooxygenase n=1 Tax=Pseudomyxococcus hansupus TaxID=1297742 RepID=A0A0H4WVZ6_9BACT|nr:putative flavin-containing monooxygenase [Myxococcus hansupus]
MLESASGLGGIWDAARADSPMSRNTHIIASKTIQAFPGFPMPATYPDYPSHALVLDYLRAYARHFGLEPHLRFNTRVARMEPSGTAWRVEVEGEAPREYAGVVVATGHDRLARVPRFPGEPTLQVLHSQDFKHPQQLWNKRVLVVGAGQSAADVLCESAMNAARTFHSTRRGFYCMPKYLMGRPTDTLLQLRAPTFLRRVAYALFFGFLKRRSRALGIPIPAAERGLVIPILGDQLHHHYTHGDIHHKGDVLRVEGDRVFFDDGTDEQIDVIFLATGYQPSYPFIDRKHLNWPESAHHPSLYLHIFPPETDMLFVAGLVRPVGAHWDIYESQGQLIAAYLQARTRAPDKARHLERVRRGPQPDLLAGIHFYNAQEYPLVVEKQEYLHHVGNHLRKLG